MTTVAAGLALLAGLSTPTTIPLAGGSGPTTEARALLASSHASERSGDALALMRDLNVLRAAQGLAPLVLDPTLCSVARSHAIDMASQHYFSHTSLDGRTPFDRLTRAGVHYGYAGENLALDIDERSASRELWRSNEHRENILEPHYAKIGVAAVRDGDDGEIFVEDFSD